MLSNGTDHHVNNGKYHGTSLSSLHLISPAAQLRWNKLEYLQNLQIRHTRSPWGRDMRCLLLNLINVSYPGHCCVVSNTLLYVTVSQQDLPVLSPISIWNNDPKFGYIVIIYRNKLKHIILWQFWVLVILGAGYRVSDRLTNHPSCSVQSHPPPQGPNTQLNEGNRYNSAVN